MEGLEQLIREQRGFVRASLAQFGMRGAGLDDAEQEVFLVLVRRLDDFDPGSSHRRWLWGISRNVARALRRRERRPPVAAPKCEPCSLEDRVHVDEAIAALDDHQRRAWLARVEGHTAQEIASSMRVPLTTVQWRLRTAKQRLQAFVAEVGRRCRAVVVLPRGSMSPLGCTITGVALLIATTITTSPEHAGEPSLPALAAATSEPLPRPSPSAVVPTELAAKHSPRNGTVSDDVIEIVELPEPSRRSRGRTARSRPPTGTVTPLEPRVLRLPPAQPVPR